MKAIRYTIIIIAVAIIACGAVWLSLRSCDSSERGDVKIDKALVERLTPVVKLCSVEVMDEVPVKASIGSRHMFGIIRLNGTVSFDLDSLRLSQSGDTLRFTLPKESVEVYQSMAPDSYRVIDTWNDAPLRSSRFTTAEENVIKHKITESFRRSIYRRGLVSRARREAVARLTPLFQSIFPGYIVEVSF